MADDREGRRALKAVCCFQWAVKSSRLAGASANLFSANGARMPSTADDVFAEIRSAALRVASGQFRR